MRWPVCIALGLGVLVLSVPQARAEVAQLRLDAPEPRLDHTRAGLFGNKLSVDRLVLDPREVPLDQGGGDRAPRSDPATRQVLCGFLGFFPGFGIGHLLAGSRDGFILFLVVDLAVLTAAILLSAIAPYPFYVLAWVAWVVEHVFQGYDAYVTAGGAKVVERSMNALMYARRDADEVPLPQLSPAIRTLSFNF